MKTLSPSALSSRYAGPTLTNLNWPLRLLGWCINEWMYGTSIPGALLVAGKAATLTMVILLCGCASLQPGADPVVVRAEQTTKMAELTFVTFLSSEHANRDF